jgi:hypothetical protein
MCIACADNANKLFHSPRGYRMITASLYMRSATEPFLDWVRAGSSDRNYLPKVT